VGVYVGAEVGELVGEGVWLGDGVAKGVRVGGSCVAVELAVKDGVAEGSFSAGLHPARIIIRNMLRDSPLSKRITIDFLYDDQLFENSIMWF